MTSVTSYVGPRIILLPQISLKRDDCWDLLDLAAAKDADAFLALARRLAAERDPFYNDRHVTVAEVLRVPKDRHGRNFVFVLMQGWTSKARVFMDAILCEFTTPVDHLALVEIFATRDAVRNSITALAADNNTRDIVQIMASRHLALGQKSRHGLSPMHIAIAKDHFEILRDFVVAGCNVNLQNEMGETPLHWAVGFGDLRKVDLLMQHGAEASLDVRSRMGEFSETPVEMAERLGDGEIEAILREVRQ